MLHPTMSSFAARPTRAGPFKKRYVAELLPVNNNGGETCPDITQKPPICAGYAIALFSKRSTAAE
jgi:hypothetical protein